MNSVFSFVPILFLIWLMVKNKSLPSNQALPLSAALLYFITLIVFEYEPNLVHANVVSGFLVAWTPILIIAGAIFLFKTMEETGGINMIKKWLNEVTENKVAQLMIVGWAFPFLLEGASGFGTPAAIAAPVLVGLGYKAVRVAVLVLIMNTVPVSFGAVGTPTWFGFSAIDLSESETLTIAFNSAAIHSIASFFIVIIALLQIVPFKKILDELIFIILSIALTVIPYLIVANYNYEFPALVGGVTGLLGTVLLAKKKIGLKNSPTNDIAKGTGSHVNTKQLIKASFPLWGTLLLLILTRVPQLGIKSLLISENNSFSLSLGTLGDFSISSSLVLSLENIFQTETSWSHKLLYVPSLLPFALVSLLTFWVFRSSRNDISRVFNKTVIQMKNPVLALFGALVFVNLMMMGGDRSAVNTIGNVLASISGDRWSFFASFLGALGSFFSGSATISNLTFAGIQNSIAMDTGIDRTVILALQSVGASYGNMVCINNIVAVTSVLTLSNQDGVILKQAGLPAMLYGVIAAIAAWILF
ncbi:MAG: L-lactate permease [Bacteroidota bacterium]